jgi:thioredoxin reductase (NADPH)
VAGTGEDVVTTHGAGRFIGELNLLTGQAAYLTARVRDKALLHRVPPVQLRRLMDEDPELSDLVLRAFLARRQLLREGPGAQSLEIVGSGFSAAALALRTYAARQQLPHVWVDVDIPAGAARASTLGLRATDLPAAVLPTQVLRASTPGTLAEALGLSYQAHGPGAVDLVVVGAGPSGLAAGVYGASEGLKTVVLDAIAVGGQAAASSRIENYLGFVSGISGADLTANAMVQAQKFGARISSPCQVCRLDLAGNHLRVVLADGTAIDSRAVVVATGARYRSLPLDRWAEFEGAGIYYAATDLEARACASRPTAVVGGANSAGQAALYLAGRGSAVTLVVRGANLADGMSSYLAERIQAHPDIAVRTRSEVTSLAGGDHLGAITVCDNATGAEDRTDCQGLFCFIGATPATEWLAGVVVLDSHGFVLTDTQLSDSDLGATWETLQRRPLPYETSQPGVFAVGDARAGSMKRVAAAVGEGASAVRSVHRSLGVAQV